MNIKQTLHITSLLVAMTSLQAGFVLNGNDTAVYTGSDVVFTPLANLNSSAFLRDVDAANDNKYRGGLFVFEWTGSNNYQIQGIRVITDRMDAGAEIGFHFYELSADPAGLGINRSNLEGATQTGFDPLVSETLSVTGANSYNDGAAAGGRTDGTLTWSFATQTLTTGSFYGVNIVGTNAGAVGENFVWRSDDTGTDTDGNYQYFKSDSSSGNDYLIPSTEGEWSMALVAIPEPGTLALMGIALGALALFRRRR